MARKGNPISVRNYQSIFIDILIYLVLISLSLTFMKLGIPIMAFCDSGEDDESRICAHPPAEGSSNAQLDLDLTLRPPGPTAEEIERELSSFLSSFGNRGVTSSVLQNTKIKLQLDVASPAKLLKIRELMRDLQSRPVPAFQARDALLKALAQWERDQTRDP
uniref:hypothetical protein n=1 Tax=Helianthus occidentalis TaxID=73303 RepID=UPI001D1132CD|nr:hypothetical protein LK184_mgp07 [Helianthus occidentalis]YP_010191864.1 hypothetical protein LK292_mgp27 [Helianthus tuberosus]QZL38878.1 hypothetical protein [Helianthus occidentalis]QZL38908.1 hypothetical protein [Helianthus tuberosus]UBT13010.1 hypothetical protein [Helianthus strumosus]